MQCVVLVFQIGVLPSVLVMIASEGSIMDFGFEIIHVARLLNLKLPWLTGSQGLPSLFLLAMQIFLYLVVCSIPLHSGFSDILHTFLFC